MDILGQSALLVAVVSFGLGTSVVARNPKNKLFLGFFLFGLLIFGWAIAFFLNEVYGTRLATRALFYFQIWTIPGAIAFNILLLRISHLKFHDRLLKVSVASSIGFTVLFLFTRSFARWELPAILWCRTLLTLQLVYLFWRSRRRLLADATFIKIPTVGLQKQGLSYFAFLLLVWLIPTHPHAMSNQWFSSGGNIAIALAFFFISQVITQQRLLNVEALMSRIFVLTVMATVLTVLYSVLLFWIEHNPALFFLNSFIVSFFLLSLLEPVRGLIRIFTERLLTQRYLRIEQFLNDSRVKLKSATEIGQMIQYLFEVTDFSIQPTYQAIYLLRGEGTKFRRVRSQGKDLLNVDAHSTPREVLVNHPLVERVRAQRLKGDLPVILDQMIESEIDRTTSDRQRDSYRDLSQALRALGGNLLIPILDGNRILGFSICYAPNPPEPWGGNWGLLSVVYPFFDEVGDHLRRLEIFANQKERDRLATLGEMAAGLAHEIRNPLGAIKGAAQLLEGAKDTLNLQDQEFLTVIIDETNRLNKVVSQFLDYSKTPSLEFETIDLMQLLVKTVEHLTPSMSENIVIEVDLSHQPIYVQGITHQLQQVFVNLIQNAEKALHENDGNQKPRIKVYNELHDDTVSVSVEDNGHGIKKENIEKIFIPFFTTSPQGTGLGLPICQKIVEAHKGRIDVVSEEGRFTRFTVFLPLKAKTKI